MLFKKKEKKSNESVIVDKDAVVKLLNTNPDALMAFERAYRENVLAEAPTGFFETNSRHAAEQKEGVLADDIPELEELISRIVDGFVAETPVWKYKNKRILTSTDTALPDNVPVTMSDIARLPVEVRPQATVSLQKRDLSMDALSYDAVLQMYILSKNDQNPQTRKWAYNKFRQGLDILDLDPILYEILGQNKNSMGYWLPAMAPLIDECGFFKIPDTTIIKVPMNLLQLTRCEYGELTRTTLDIVDRFCSKVFNLDEAKDYFIKTGTYSSKFDFRNALVHGAKEVRELGEYLLFIHYQANMMAGPLTCPSIYGVSTTNEWVVREFIPDKENNPCIYKGLPLHTEYRVFVDFDTRKVIGINPYWDPAVMKQRFGHEADADSPHQIHDYIIYTAHEDVLMDRYRQNKDRVIAEMERVLALGVPLSGQWSVDIMQNGDDFWFIDMALAKDSALIQCVPAELRHDTEENWIPEVTLKCLVNGED